MAKKRLGISSFDLQIKFKDKDEAYKYAKRLIEHIRYVCKIKGKDGWSAEAMVCISNIKGNSCFVRYEHNGKRGRPRKIKEYYSNKVNVDWHIHILLVSMPMYAFRDEIKNYIDNRWGVRIDKNTYKKNTNIRKAEYFIDQADKLLFCNCNNTGEERIPKGYSLKDLYNAYMKMMTAKNYNAIENIDKRLEAEDKYYNILKFYWNLSKKEDKKMVDKFIEKVKKDKISAEYERLRNNKVQKNEIGRRRRDLINSGY